MSNIKDRIGSFQKEIVRSYKKSLSSDGDLKDINIQRIEWYLEEFNSEYGTRYDVGNIIKLIKENDIIAGMIRNKFQIKFNSRNKIYVYKNGLVCREYQDLNAKNCIKHFYENMSAGDVQILTEKDYLLSPKEVIELKEKSISNGKAPDASFLGNIHNDHKLYAWHTSKGYCDILNEWSELLGWGYKFIARKEQ